MTEKKPKIVLSSDEVIGLIESSPEFRELIIEGFAKVIGEAVENAKREAGAEPHQSG